MSEGRVNRGNEFVREGKRERGRRERGGREREREGRGREGGGKERERERGNKLMEGKQTKMI